MTEPRAPAPLSLPRLPPGTSLGSLEPLELARWDGAPPALATAVRVAVTGDRLRARFSCQHDGLYADPSLPRDRSVHGLWQLDVVELFLSGQPDGLPYRELEASPAGQWLALAFDGLRRPAPGRWTPAVELDVTVRAERWEAELALPLAALELGAGSGPWRLGLFRIHGRPGRREHFSLRPTGTPAPDFHQPEAWLPIEPLA